MNQQTVLKKTQLVKEYFDGVLPEALRAWIEAAVANNTFSESALFEKTRKLAPTYDGYAWGKTNKTARLTIDARAASELGIPAGVDIDFLVAARLMLEGLTSLRKYVEQHAQAFRVEVDSLVTVWSSKKPAWMPLQFLKVWAVDRVRLGPAHTTHPAVLYLEDLGAERLAQMGVLRFAANRPCLATPVTLNVLGHDISMDVRLDRKDFMRALWLCEKTPIEEAVRQVLADLGRHPQHQAQQAINEFCEQGLCLQPDPRDLASMGLESGQWAQLIENLLRSHDLSRPADFARVLRRKVDHRIREVALQDCVRALPEKLSDLYPLARSMHRRLILVVGPTNSGKTYRAVERMKQASSSLYLGPLRLLALEIRDRLQDDGYPTSLVTGELVEEVEGAKATASTIEMLDFDRTVEVAVIDEVQMLADDQRGSAWVQAILGSAASEVWMLGSPEARGAVQALAEYLGEPLEIVETQRLSALSVDKAPTALSAVPAQSAIVAFSRREVLDIAAELKEQHGRKVSVIYGALSPEVRRDQADKFRLGEHEIVVATDAISMGLNLPVHRMYFSTGVKWNGVEEEPIPADLTWQIAGRAGRFGHHDQGHVGALDRHTLEFLQSTLHTRPSAVDHVFRHGPTWPLVSAIAKALSLRSLFDILQVFLKEFRIGVDKRFISAIGEDQLDVAQLVDRHEIPLRAKLTLSNAPIPMVKGEVPDVFERFIRSVASGEVFPFEAISEYHSERAGYAQDAAEYAVKVLTLYCWMHYRFPQVFPDFEVAKSHIDALNVAINRHLARSKSRRCRECNTPLRVKHPHPMCDKCFRASRGWASFGYRY